MVDRNATVKLSRKPPTGLIPRGVTGRTYATGRTEWQVSKGDLLTAHKMHIAKARAYRELGDYIVAMVHLTAAATVRRHITRPKRITTLDILRGRA